MNRLCIFTLILNLQVLRLLAVFEDTSHVSAPYKYYLFEKMNNQLETGITKATHRHFNDMKKRYGSCRDCMAEMINMIGPTKNGIRSVLTLAIELRDAHLLSKLLPYADINFQGDDLVAIVPPLEAAMIFKFEPAIVLLLNRPDIKFSASPFGKCEYSLLKPIREDVAEIMCDWFFSEGKVGGAGTEKALVFTDYIEKSGYTCHAMEFLQFRTNLTNKSKSGFSCWITNRWFGGLIAILLIMTGIGVWWFFVRKTNEKNVDVLP
eukprot:194453_1